MVFNSWLGFAVLNIRAIYYNSINESLYVYQSRSHPIYHSETNCLCGAVKIIAEEVNPKFTVCHCRSCRTWGGSSFFAVKCGTRVKIEGEDKVKMYESSSWASRGFCAECGTHLFYKFKASGEYNIPVGLFQNLKGLEMDMQYFSDMRPSYYCFTNTTKEMTTAEVMAYFSAKV